MANFSKIEKRRKIFKKSEDTRIPVCLFFFFFFFFFYFIKVIPCPEWSGRKWSGMTRACPLAPSFSCYFLFLFFFFFFFWRDFSRSKDRRQRLPSPPFADAQPRMPAEFYWRPYVPIKEKYRTPDGERGNVRVALPTQAEIKYLKHARRLRISFLLLLLLFPPFHPLPTPFPFFDPLLHLRCPVFLFSLFFFSFFLRILPPPPFFLFIPRLLIRRYEIGWLLLRVG